MRNIYKYCIVLFTLLYACNVNGQINNNIEILDINETIKLNTDRDLYISGERIYFTADYFINNKKSFPVLSKVLYIELINLVGNMPIIQQKISILNHNANNSILIPKDIVSGNYILKAYTQYQRNFSEYNYAYSFITILNPENNQYPLIFNNKTDSIDIVPEGNVLLRGVKNKVVFRIPSQYLNKNNKFFITDSALNKIKEIKINKNGFAQEDFIINKTNNFNLVVKTNIGDSVIKPFPNIYKKGIQTSVNKINKNIIYKIVPKGIDSENLKYKISVFSKDYRIKHSEKVDLGNKTTSILLEDKIFAYGINYIVLYNSSGVIEKINSIYNNYKINEIAIKIKKSTFSTKDSVDTFVSFENNLEEIPIISISVSLQGTKKEEHDFIPALYLSNPVILQDYLQNINNDTLQSQIMILFDKIINKDLFLTEVNNSITPSLINLPETRNLTITGQLINKKTKELVSNHEIYLSVLYNNPQFHVCNTKENGEFTFVLNNFENINDIFLCPKTSKNNELAYEIIVNNSFSQKNIPFGQLPTFINNANKKLIKSMYINSQIQQKLYNKTTIIKHKREKNNIFNINGNKKTTFIKDFIKLKNFEELFHEIIPDVKFKRKNGEYFFSIYNDKRVPFPYEPLILVDKVPVQNSNVLKLINISEIEKIEVINREYILGSHRFYGVIMITTKTDNFSGIKLPKSGIFIEYQGLEQNCKNYINVNHKNSNKILDFRNTLYWEPNIKLTNKTYNFKFNTLDKKGVYNINIKGYDNNGNIYYGNKKIVVE